MPRLIFSSLAAIISALIGSLALPLRAARRNSVAAWGNLSARCRKTTSEWVGKAALCVSCCRSMAFSVSTRGGGAQTPPPNTHHLLFFSEKNLLFIFCVLRIRGPNIRTFSYRRRRRNPVETIRQNFPSCGRGAWRPAVALAAGYSAIRGEARKTHAVWMALKLKGAREEGLHPLQNIALYRSLIDIAIGGCVQFELALRQHLAEAFEQIRVLL